MRRWAIGSDSRFQQRKGTCFASSKGRRAPAVIKRLISLGLQRAEIDAAIIPLRTLQHRRSRRERLTLEESDRVLRVIRVLSLAESVYGNRETALASLAAKPACAPGGPRPAFDAQHGHRQPDCRRSARTNRRRYVRLDDPLEDQPASRPQRSRRTEGRRPMALCWASRGLSGRQSAGAASGSLCADLRE